jgi:hypothetical protein
MREIMMTLVRYLIGVAVGWLGVTLTPEQSMELTVAVFGAGMVVTKVVLKPLFYKMGERQPGDTASGKTPEPKGGGG